MRQVCETGVWARCVRQVYETDRCVRQVLDASVGVAVDGPSVQTWFRPPLFCSPASLTPLSLSNVFVTELSTPFPNTK